ncbi:MAG: AAA family ATPase [Candidatus Methanomethylophilaceae archaeon]|nr:AAA family ATPase [Candidatus Methanomethylophilaceae archaeon]
MAEGILRDELRYPFPAFVGNDLARKAIMVALSSADIHSVLVCGARGTGKSVLARSMQSVSGGRVMVNLPVGCTEDQVFGGMDVEKTLGTGRKTMVRNVLQRADGNILFADNVNLMSEHIVHQVLNAAEDGAYSVEREGISDSFDTRFLFVATMDPEEGSLSDHLLDRFDICVFLSTIDDEALRTELAIRRLRFDRSPSEFVKEYAGRTADAEGSVTEARKRARFTRVPDGYCEAISEVCNQLSVSGHRGDISVMNAACALAALDGRDTANLDDLKVAAAICLEHRRNDSSPPPQERPPEPPPDEDDQEGSEDRDDDPPENDGSPSEDDREGDSEGDSEPPELPPPEDPEDLREQVFDVGDAFKVIDYMPKNEEKLEKGASGRRSSSKREDSSGRCIGYRIPRGKVTDVALCASIRAAAPYQVLRDHSELAIVLRKEDLREKVRERRQGNDILFLVDGSGSIGAQKRMVAVKGAILSMLRDAYQKRDRIGMAVFRVDRCEEILPLTKSTLKAYHVLQEIPTGGRTPLTQGLIKGHEILKDSAKGGFHPVMVILSDGRCNVSCTPGITPVDEMLATAGSLSRTGTRFIVIDTEAGRLRFGLALELCRALNGTYLRLEDLNAEYIERSVTMAMNDDRG